MAQVYFDCSSANGTRLDRHVADVGDLVEARDHATRLVRLLVTSPTLEDWRGWILRVNDDLDHEVFVLPFASVLGKPH